MTVRPVRSIRLFKGGLSDNRSPPVTDIRAGVRGGGSTRTGSIAVGTRQLIHLYSCAVVSALRNTSMSGTHASGKTGSEEQLSATDERSIASMAGHEPAAWSAYPKVGSRVITEDEESFCRECGLIVADEWVDRSPTLDDLGMVRETDQSTETVDPTPSAQGPVHQDREAHRWTRQPPE